MNWDWQGLLKQINDAVLQSPYLPYLPLSPELIEKAWIGFDPATDEQIAAAEKRLGVTLPPSYKQFLRVSNGWRTCSPSIDYLFPVEKIDWTRNFDPSFIAIWENSAASVPDDTPFIERDMRHTLQISDWGDSALLLLNPQKQTPAGEWEAWFFANWSPGATAFPAFWDLMSDQLEGYNHKKTWS